MKKVSATSEPRPANLSFLANGRFYHSGSQIVPAASLTLDLLVAISYCDRFYLAAALK